MIRFAFLIIAIVLAVSSVDGRRTSQSVRGEKERTAQQIRETNRKIDDNLAQTERELAQLERLRTEIGQQSVLVEKISRRRAALDARVKAVEDTLAFLDTRIADLRKAYAEALRSLRRQRTIASESSVLIASESAAQASRRLRYLNQLTKWEHRKGQELKEALADASRRREELEALRVKVAETESEHKLRLNELSQQQSGAEQLVKSLRKQGGKLKEALKRQQAQAEQLERELQRLIDEESRSDTAKAETPVFVAPDGSSFADVQGRLPRPIIGQSAIVSNFGRHTHEDFERVTVQNNGVDFEAPAGTQAVAVFPGVVSMVIVMQGYQNVVLVRHGEYLTVYAGLTDVIVRKGDELKAGQPLGTLQTSPAGPDRGRLHFEIRHEKEKLNPADWLQQ